LTTSSLTLLGSGCFHSHCYISVESSLLVTSMEKMINVGSEGARICFNCYMLPTGSPNLVSVLPK